MIEQIFDGIYEKHLFIDPNTEHTNSLQYLQQNYFLQKL